MSEKRLSMKKKTVIFTLILAGIIGILSAIIVTPEFAAKYISPDNHLEIKTIELLRYSRLLSLFIGCFMLLISILFYKLPEKYIVFPHVFARRALVLSIIVYLLFFGYNTLTRTHDFGDPDTMNFVDIARNIATGRGISQSALGFNQAHFSIDDQIPMPLTAQPPLYPLLIALLSFFGLPYAGAGLLISIICYGLILLIAYRVSFEIYDVRAALLSVGFLLLYAPLYKVSKTTFSEPTSIVFFLISFWLLIQMCNSATYRSWIPAGAGLATGLTFATRYAFLALFPLSVLFIFLESRRKLRDLSLYIAGFIIPAGAVLARNFLVSGKFLSTRISSTDSLNSLIHQALRAVTEEYSNGLKPDIQVALLILSVLILVALLFRRHKLLDTIYAVFFRKGGYLLTFWVLGYMTFLIFVKTRVHLDPINWRLILPAGIILALLFAAFIIKSTEMKTQYILCIVLIIALFMIKNEVMVTIRKPIVDRDQYIANSERLSWVAQHTTSHDLIIADGAVDICFYLDRPAAISFSPFPEANVPEYEKIMTFSKKNCNKYKNIYLIVHPPEYLISHAPDMERADPNKQEKNLKRAYGPFISDIIFGKLKKYPAVSFLDRLSDSYIYKINCQL